MYDVFDVVSTPGTPKSDFHLIDIDGKEIAWISHKDGRTAKDFQQWGGISQSKEPIIYSNEEVQAFIKDLKSNYPDGLPPATTLYRKIKNNKLKMLSVYGNNFGSALGQQNVTILLQGDIKLVKRNFSYELSSNNVHFNGDSIIGDFEPVLMAIHKGDRSDAGVKKTRIVISPIGGRKGKEFP
jgi:alanine-alpha-ketoisovalerate/valine-pyruvate aminotransferase